jgi:hypothetical protein
MYHDKRSDPDIFIIQCLFFGTVNLYGTLYGTLIAGVNIKV